MVPTREHGRSYGSARTDAHKWCSAVARLLRLHPSSPLAMTYDEMCELCGIDHPRRICAVRTTNIIMAIISGICLARIVLVFNGISDGSGLSEILNIQANDPLTAITL